MADSLSQEIGDDAAGLGELGRHCRQWTPLPQDSEAIGVLHDQCQSAQFVEDSVGAFHSLPQASPSREIPAQARTYLLHERFEF